MISMTNDGIDTEQRSTFSGHEKKVLNKDIEMPVNDVVKEIVLKKQKTRTQKTQMTQRSYKMSQDSTSGKMSKKYPSIRTPKTIVSHLESSKRVTPKL